MSFDTEPHGDPHGDPHGECAFEIQRLKTELAAAESAALAPRSAREVTWIAQCETLKTERDAALAALAEIAVGDGRSDSASAHLGRAMEIATKALATLKPKVDSIEK